MLGGGLACPPSRVGHRSRLNSLSLCPFPSSFALHTLEVSSAHEEEQARKHAVVHHIRLEQLTPNLLLSLWHRISLRIPSIPKWTRSST